MSDTDAPRAKGGKLKALAKVAMFVVMFAAGAVAGGGGAVIAIAQMGGLGLPMAKPAAHDEKASTGEGGEKSKIDYVEIDNAFTSNLVDTGRYLQLRIAVSTTRGAPMTAALTQHKLALISAVLAVLGEAGEADVADRAAKDRLRARIRAAINDVLQHKAGLAGVDEVFFTSLVVQ